MRLGWPVQAFLLLLGATEITRMIVQLRGRDTDDLSLQELLQLRTRVINAFMLMMMAVAMVFVP